MSNHEHDYPNPQELRHVSGFSPTSQLVQGPDGTLYSTTTQGEGHVRGTLFKLQPDGFTALKWFTNSLEGDNHQAA
jgi:hypothetical protein